jgi:ferredoxin
VAIVENVATMIETANCDWCTDCEAVCRTGAIMCPFEIVSQEP